MSDVVDSADFGHASYPVNLLLRGQRCLVVGGGRVGFHKISGLLAAGASVTVIAPCFDPRVQEMAGLEAGRLRLERRSYLPGDVKTYRLVITCTDDSAVNQQVFSDGERLNVWVNSADDPANCRFTLPSVARQGDLAISVSTNGRSPALASWLRKRFEVEFDQSYVRLLDLLSQVRQSVRQTIGTSEVPGWMEALDGGLLDLVSEGRDTEAQKLLSDSLGIDCRSIANASGAGS